MHAGKLRETWEACPQEGLHGSLEGRSTERTDSQVGAGIARRAGMTNTKKCAHPACKCLAAEGSDYCTPEGLHGSLEGRSTERTDSQVGAGIARRAGMTNTKKCAHPACKCLAAEG